MPSSKKTAAESAPLEPSGVTVVQRYKAYGEARELGIHCIPQGYIDVEQLSDGTYRIASADNSEDVVAPELDADPLAEDAAPEAEPDGEPEPEAAPVEDAPEAPAEPEQVAAESPAE